MFKNLCQCKFSNQISMTLEKIVWTDSLNYILVLTRYYKKDILLYCDPTKKIGKPNFYWKFFGTMHHLINIKKNQVKRVLSTIAFKIA